MKALLFGATGMVGQGVLRECLLADDVDLVQAVGRNASGSRNTKLREVVHEDLWHYDVIAQQLAGFEACFFCLGVTSSGKTEADYERVTYGMTLAAGEILSRLNPRMTFIYVSGAGTDSSERSGSMWARVKGKTENALLRLPFAAYMFRPAIIQPLFGVKSKTKLYNVFYTIGKPLLPVVKMMFPNFVLTTQQIGLAMLEVARHGYGRRILETKDIRVAAGTAQAQGKAAGAS
jgi:uncharacterized protein YbjT (DUF2867 family)